MVTSSRSIEDPSGQSDPEPGRQPSIWKKELWPRRTREHRPAPEWVRRALLLLCGILTGLGAMVFVAIVFLTLDPLRLETPAPRPGAHWIAHLEVWRALLVLSVVAVAVAVLFVAARTLARRSVNELEKGTRERLVLGALSCVFYLGLLALMGEMISGDYDGSGSPGLTISIICVGLMLCAGVVLADRLKGTSSLHARFHERPVGQKSYRRALLALVPLCVLGASASYANLEGAATAMDQVPSGNIDAGALLGLGSAPSTAFPTSLLVRLSGGFGWASVGFTAFSASDPNFPVSADSPSCPSRDCVVAGTGNGGSQALGFVQGSSVTWRAGALPGRDPLVSPLACSSTLDCIVTNDNYGFAVTGDGGRHWSDLRLPENIEASPSSPFATTVACVPKGPCFALAVRELSLAARRRCHCQSSPSVLLSVSRDGDVKVQAIPGSNLDLWSLSCPTPLVCFAAGSDLSHAAVIVRTEDAGRTWQLVDLASGTPTLDELVCPDADRCVAVGDTGWPNITGPLHAVILMSTDGGTTWRSWRGGPLGTVLTSIACIPSGPCIAAGATVSPGSWDGILPAGTAFVVSTADIGLSWTRVRSPRGRFAVSGAACGAKGCVMTGEDLEPGPAGDFFEDVNWNGSPATTGVVLTWTPTGELHLLRTLPLPSGVAQPVLNLP